MQILLYMVFTLSGAAGLIYESIWSHYLGLFVGHSAYAQIIVLAIFLGGMSLGALAVGQYSERLKEPLLWYAGIELAVGVMGFLFHQVFQGVTFLAYTFVFPPLVGTFALTLAKWAMAGALIVPQSIILGATFPCMSAGVLRRSDSQPGRVLSLLYFTNSIGAALGCLVAGFYLIAAVGLPGTVLTAACCNVLVAVMTYLTVRTSQPSGGYAQRHVTIGVSDSVQHSIAGRIACKRRWRLLLFVSFATAVASFIYEVAWIRLLSLVMGSATHAFELMLSAFILGLALGALWVRQHMDRFRDPLRALGVVQWCMGAAALATLPVYLESFGWMAALLAAFNKTVPGYVAFNVARYGIALAVMLPATFCAGITLPLLTKTLLETGTGERAIGWVYGTNTFGSIVGVVLAGLILIPWIGLKALLIVGACCDMAVGVLLLTSLDRPVWPRLRLAGAAGVGMVLVVLLVAWGTTMDRTLLYSGVYQHGTLPRAGSYETLFYKDGRTATVAGARTRDGTRILMTNGKPDASLTADWFADGKANTPPRALRQDAATQTLAALVSLAYAPHARNVAVIGQGSGQSSHLLLGSPSIERFVTIDIEPEMIAGSRIFYPANRRVFDDPRAAFVVDDARSFFATQQQRYDLILSEPSNPWVSGVASLFTTEFYARIAPLLSEHGIFAQWCHLYELNDELVVSVLAALHDNFRTYELFLLDNGNILIIASNLPSLPAPEWSVCSLPLVAEDLRLFLPLVPESLEATRLLNRSTLAPLLAHWSQRNSDFFPVLDLGAEQARYLLTAASGFVGLVEARFDMVAPFVGRLADLGSVPLAPIANHPRMQARALGARLRAWRAGEGPTGQTDKSGLDTGTQRLWAWENTLTAQRPPADWRAWLTETLIIEAALHTGTTGVVDETFYSALHRYFETYTPPAEVCDALLFTEGLGRWDFATASAAADRLLQPAQQGQSWVPVDQLRDGAVVAKLLVGDVAGARNYFQALAKRTERSPHDLRSGLLAAYVLYAEQLPKGPVSRSTVTWQCPTR